MEGTMRQHQESREKLEQAIKEEHAGLKVCAKHVTGTVYYDGTECPACIAIKEWLALTNDME
jgi:hypothetical protein